MARKPFTAEWPSYGHLQAASRLYNQQEDQTLSEIPSTTGREISSFTLSEEHSSHIFKTIMISALLGTRSVEVKRKQKNTPQKICILSY